MELVTKSADFCGSWLLENLEGRPDGDTALTWFVPASFLYVTYARAASLRRIHVYDLAEFWAALRLIFPKVEATRLRGEKVFIGVRLRSDVGVVT